jgi:general secretion pathway protein A
VLVIDEAQNLSAEVLEQLRLLTNLETRERKLLQVILVGQPELREMLARPELEQLAQRVIARYHLDALTPAETEQYIRHRMDVAGLDRPFPFEPRALRRIHDAAHGVPRRINLLCDRALLGAYANSRATVDRKTVGQAAEEVFGRPAVASPVRHRTALVLGLGLAAGAGLYAAALRVAQDDEPPRPVALTQPAVHAAPKANAASAAAASPAAAPKLLENEDQAWRELAALWNVQVGDGNACAQLAQQQLQCFTKNLNLALIRELARPGIVTLDAQQGAPRYALLTALTRDTATLRAGGTEQTVTLAALAARWDGEFATLWKAPPGYEVRGAPAPETVEWMQARLGAGSGEANAPLKERLRAFQLAHGLPPDGQAGPLTYMQLGRVDGAGEPRLAMKD